MTNDEPVYLYAIAMKPSVEDGEWEYLKFGITDDLAKRLQNLQNGNPIKLEYVDSAPFPDRASAKRAEEALLKLAKIDQAGGEWFYFTDKVAYMLDALQELASFPERAEAFYEEIYRAAEELNV